MAVILATAESAVRLELITRRSRVIVGLPDSAEDGDYYGRVLAVLEASRHTVYLPLTGDRFHSNNVNWLISVDGSTISLIQVLPFAE
jgi:hypothetical protein